MTSAPSQPSPPPAPDLSTRPLIWFAPLPALPVNEGRPFIGAEDFMSLFEADAPWATAAAGIQVFKLYGEWLVRGNASDQDLARAVHDLTRRGMAIGFEAGPLVPTQSCGDGVEGFGGGVEPSLVAARRIEAAGGTVRFIALDEPFYFATTYDGPNACRWSSQQVAVEVARYIEQMERAVPGLVIGDIEPLVAGLDPRKFGQWLDAYREVSGAHFPFLHVDVDWGRPDWAEATLAVEGLARERGVVVGVIYNGSWDDPTDEAWIAAAGERVKAYQLRGDGRPDHVIFQSWVDHPDRSLPDTDPTTFTGFIRQYLEDPTQLGIRTEGPGANLASDRPVTASSDLQAPASNAVDGYVDTSWGAGDFPVQWIEIDLERRRTIAEIRLIVGQSPDGKTVHRVYGRATPNGPLILLHEFSGRTEDLEQLVWMPSQPVEGIRVVRVETVTSPSWVAWREIEVISA